MMSSKDSMALAVGQAMLDRIAASAPELSGVGDMDGDVIPADPDVDEPGTGVEPVDGTLVFDYLLREQLVLERDLAERGYFIDDPVHQGHHLADCGFTVSIGGMTAPIARVTLDGAGEQGSSLLSLQLAEDIPDFVRSMSSAAADQIGKALLMDAKTDAGFLPSITLADYLPKGVTIDANPKAKA